MRRPSTFRMSVLISALLAWPPSIATAGAEPKSVYADPLASPGGDGTSWDSAFRCVQQGLDALEPGDTLYTRGEFRETVTLPVSLNDITWIGNTDADRPTWMRGDIVLEADAWTISDFSSEVLVAMIPDQNGFPDGRPGGAVYDHKRDDELGTATGIPGIRPWYGHLIAANSPQTVADTDGSWWYDSASGQTYVNPPGPITEAQTSLIALCSYAKNAVLLLSNDNVHIIGVNTMLTPSYAGNAGYGFKGSGEGNTIENAIIVDSGWHSAGFAINKAIDNTLKDIVVYAGGVPGSFNISNPFVFYSTGITPDSGNRGIDLLYHAYPLLRFDGQPLFTEFRPRLGYSHPDFAGILGGIEWHRCVQIEYQRELEIAHGITLDWNGSFISAANLPTGWTSNTDPELAAIRVYDSVAIGGGASPRYGIAYFDTIFDRRGFAQSSLGTVRGSGPLWLVGCVVEPGQLRDTGQKFFKQADGNAFYFIDCSTFIISDEASSSGFLFDIGNATSRIHLRSSLFHRAATGPFLLSQPNAWQSLHLIIEQANSVLSGFDPPIRHTNPGIAPRTIGWWLANIDPDTRFDITPEFIDADSLNLTPIPGSPIAVELATPLLDELFALTVNGVPYQGRFGHAQTPLDLDINADGTANIEDLYAASLSAGDTLPEAIDRLIAARLRDHEPADITATTPAPPGN
ncbi:MAG: hypothetical protein ACTS3F_00795 [Phycisphaerales bacterium]